MDPSLLVSPNSSQQDCMVGNTDLMLSYKIAWNAVPLVLSQSSDGSRVYSWKISLSSKKYVINILMFLIWRLFLYLKVLRCSGCSLLWPKTLVAVEYWNQLRNWFGTWDVLYSGYVNILIIYFCHNMIVQFMCSIRSLFLDFRVMAEDVNEIFRWQEIISTVDQNNHIL